MTPVHRRALGLAGRVMSYPHAGYHDGVRAFRTACAEAGLDDLADLDTFVRTARSSTVERLQEAFTQSFDLNPACALEVGWHLYGEDYARGEFLSRMRAALRAHGIPEGTELPDHLASLLALVALTEPTAADDLLRDALTPAVGKMLGALEKTESPFLPILRAIHRLVAVGVQPAGGVGRV